MTQPFAALLPTGISPLDTRPANFGTRPVPGAKHKLRRSAKWRTAAGRLASRIGTVQRFPFEFLARSAAFMGNVTLDAKMGFVNVTVGELWLVL